MRRFEQSVNYPSKGAGGRIFNECLDLFGVGGESRKGEVSAPNESAPVGGRGRPHTATLHPGKDKRVNRAKQSSIGRLDWRFGLV